MPVNTIQAELLRLQLHPANLSVSSEDEGLVTLRGSLLNYWKLPSCLDGQWLLARLQGLGDDAGPEAVMGNLVAAYGKECKTVAAREPTAQLRLFDPQREPSATKSAVAKKDR